jgi:hypothetical protein
MIGKHKAHPDQKDPAAKQFCHPAAGKGFVYVTLREEQR